MEAPGNGLLLIVNSTRFYRVKRFALASFANGSD